MAKALTGYTDFERMMYLMDRTEQVGDCRIWQGGIIKTSGYGQAFGGLVHRKVYELAVGEIPKGMVIMHSCDNKLCINISHLSLGTQSDNVQDCIRKGRFTHTKHNGELNGRSKVTDEQVLEIRKLYNDGQDKRASRSYTYKELGTMFGLGTSQIARIVKFEKRVSGSNHITT